MIPLLAWPAAILVGVALGMLGSGGSILTVPLLTAILGLPEKIAVATSLPIVGLIALAGAASHARRHAVRLSSVWPFAAASVSAAFLPRRLLEPHVPAQVQRWAFAALVLIVAWRMVFAPPPAEAASRRHAMPYVLGLGLLVGSLTGLLGAGGGFVIAPALALLHASTCDRPWERASW